MHNIHPQYSGCAVMLLPVCETAQFKNWTRFCTIYEIINVYVQLIVWAKALLRYRLSSTQAGQLYVRENCVSMSMDEKYLLNITLIIQYLVESTHNTNYYILFL